MTAALQLRRISVEDYLASELASDVRHESVAGEVFARAGATNAHNRIAANLVRFFGEPLAGRSV